MLVDLKERRLAVTIFAVTSIGCFIWFCSYKVWRDSQYEVENDIGAFSIVEDQRGKEPYITIKMKCYYGDNDTYDIAWQQLLSNKECHKELFQKCFSERTLPDRHETHVLTFHRLEDINSCVCTDPFGWYTHSCHNSLDLKCCLDRGQNSVKCIK